MVKGEPADQGVILSLVAASRDECKLAWALTLVSLPVFVIVAFFAKVKLPESWAFAPSLQSVLAAGDLATMLILYTQFFVLRSPAMLVLAAGYQFSAFMAVAYTLSFSRLFAPTGLLAIGPQTTAWLYIIWHAGFPLAVIGYALLRDSGPIRQREWALAAASTGVLALVCAATLFTTADNSLLPVILRGDSDATLRYVIDGIVCSLSVVSLLVLWRKRLHSVLDIWLMVVMWAWLSEIAIASMLTAGPFDLGWYMGRVYGLIAASTLLIVLLIQTGMLFARLAHSYAIENSALRAVQVRLKATNEELEAFSHSVSHDLRVPLRAVEGFARILMEEYGAKLDAEGRRLISVVCDSARRMARMIDNILEFSRAGRTEMEMTSVDMQVEVRRAITDLAPLTEGRKISFDIGDLPPARGDGAMLQQVWANLLGNSVKYTGPRDLAVIQIGAEIRDGETVYFVRDNGVGFEMQYVDKLFGTFQRLHGSEFPGTGVGLSIVKRIVTRHGGRVWAEAEIHKGATFFFSLRHDVIAFVKEEDCEPTGVVQSAFMSAN